MLPFFALVLKRKLLPVGDPL